MKKTVAFISEHASPLAELGGVDSGGQNVYVSELAKHLRRLGYRVDIFTRWDNPGLPKVIDWIPNIRIIHIEAGPVAVIEKEYLYHYMPAFSDGMVDFIRRERVEYDLIHANFWMSAMVASDISKIFQIPFVVTFHALGAIRKVYQGIHDKFPIERIDVEKQIVRDADHIIAECPQDREDLIRYYDAVSEKISIIPCGFNQEEFYPLDRSLSRMVLKLDPDEFIVLQLGRIVPRKGIDNVIRAVSKLTTTATPARLIVVGGEHDHPDHLADPEIIRLRQIATECGLGDRVSFTGRKQRDVLKYYYAAADIFVTTPWYEPFGITPLESMACGTPVIGSNVGGIKYSIEDGKCGFLVPPNDPDTLACRLRKLLTDDGLRKSMRVHGLKRVNTGFTWTKVAEKMAALYERVTWASPAHATAGECTYQFVDSAFRNAADTFLKARTQLVVPILQAATILIDCFRRAKKVLICGNGGSAAESQHFAAELIGRFEMAHRAALPAISLTADNAVLTAWANDFDYDDVFARQVEALGQKGDVLFCFSTSGKSQNVVNAMKTAFEKGMKCIALTGNDGGDMDLYAEVNMIVPSGSTPRIQELHLHVMHTLCSVIEQNLFAINGARSKTLHASSRNGKLVNQSSAENEVINE